jgi:hypothetical protein
MNGDRRDGGEAFIMPEAALPENAENKFLPRLGGRT